MTESGYHILSYQFLCNGVCNSKGWFRLTDLTTTRGRRRMTRTVTKQPVAVCRQMCPAVPTTYWKVIIKQQLRVYSALAVSLCTLSQNV
jgi:hypothetical protein